MLGPTWRVGGEMRCFGGRRVDGVLSCYDMQAFLEVLARVCHQLPFTNRSKRRLPRSGAKMGSILSQPGDR